MAVSVRFKLFGRRGVLVGGSHCRGTEVTDVVSGVVGYPLSGGPARVTPTVSVGSGGSTPGSRSDGGRQVPPAAGVKEGHITRSTCSLTAIRTQAE